MTYWRNYKTGKLYVVIGIATDCTNDRDGTQVVLYRENGCDAVYVRDLDEFKLKFTAELLP